MGRMLLQAAPDLDVECHVLDPDPSAPCRSFTNAFTCGNFRDEATVLEFGKSLDLITIEIEDVNVPALKKLQDQGKRVFPQPQVIELIQDKGAQKEFFTQHNIPTSPYRLIGSAKELPAMADFLPAFQKLRRGGYDGRGVVGLRSINDLEKAFDAPSVVEKKVEIDKEVAVIVSRNAVGQIRCFPPVEMEFNPQANLVEFLFAPANISANLEAMAIELATRVAEKLEIVGILAVEMFIDKTGQVLVNEIAPRPHNSGHHTIEANRTSQYMQHLRAILGLPPGDTSERAAAVMVNLLGEPGASGPVVYQGLPEAMAMSGVNVHIYGKAETRPFRKMGHVTITAPTLAEAKETARKIQQTIKVTA